MVDMQIIYSVFASSVISEGLGDIHIIGAWYIQNMGKNYVVNKAVCFHADDKRIRLQERKLWGIFPG